MPLPIEAEKASEIVRLYLTGLTAQQVGQKVRVSAASVYNVLRDMEVPRRDLHQAKEIKRQLRRDRVREILEASGVELPAPTVPQNGEDQTQHEPETHPA